MCGTSAIVGLADQGQDGHVLEGDNQDSLTREMEDSLQLIRHRGPDFSEIWISPDQRIQYLFDFLIHIFGDESG